MELPTIEKLHLTYTIDTNIYYTVRKYKVEEYFTRRNNVRPRFETGRPG